MKLKLHKARAPFFENIPSGKCYPNDLDIDTLNLWWHLFPEDHASDVNYTEQYISQAEFLAKAHGWEIEWMKD